MKEESFTKVVESVAKEIHKQDERNMDRDHKAWSIDARVYDKGGYDVTSQFEISEHERDDYRRYAKSAIFAICEQINEHQFNELRKHVLVKKVIEE